MVQAARHRVRVLPGGRVEFCDPELPAGAEAEVIVLVRDPAAALPPLTAFFGQGRGCFSAAADVTAFLRVEHDSWDGKGRSRGSCAAQSASPE
jgi:hypothetical protein